MHSNEEDEVKRTKLMILYGWPTRAIPTISICDGEHICGTLAVEPLQSYEY